MTLTSSREMVLYVAERLQDDPRGRSNEAEQGPVLRRVHAPPRDTTRSSLDASSRSCPTARRPRQLLPVRRKLIDSGAAELVEEDFLGRPQHRLVPSRTAKRRPVHPRRERQTLEDVLTQLEGMTGTQVSELSHQEPGWRLTEVGETIPFSTAFLDFPQIQTPTSKRLSRSVEKRYELAAAG